MVIYFLVELYVWFLKHMCYHCNILQHIATKSALKRGSSDKIPYFISQVQRAGVVLEELMFDIRDAVIYVLAEFVR